MIIWTISYMDADSLYCTAGEEDFLYPEIQSEHGWMVLRWSLRGQCAT